MIEYRILGPLEVTSDGSPVRLGGPRQRGTLALLLLNANRVVSVEELADELYAGRPPVTAVTQVQRQISDLRKLLGEEAIETRPPGYVLRTDEGALDLARFEQLTSDASAAFDPATGADLLHRALALWRGPALADLAYEQFSAAAARRLEELRLAALEERLRLDLALGANSAVASELEALVLAHPLRERLRALQMQALYRSGRRAEALAAYREARRTLVEEIGIEPSPELQRLERAILTEDAGLEDTPRQPTVVAVSTGEESPAALVHLALALGDAEVVLVRLVPDERDLAHAVEMLAPFRAPKRVRTAAFTSADPASEIVRLATANDAELVIFDSLDELAAICTLSPAPVAFLAGAVPDPRHGVFVPFGGGEHDWAALELAAQLATDRLSIVGTRARSDRRDASRLLADASLALQRVSGIDAVPILTDDVGGAVAGGGLVVMGISSRWRSEGIGEARRALIDADLPVLLVHGGPRPSGLAPRAARTRFTWSLRSA